MPTERRKIPKSDRSLSSLYMSANTIKNLPKDKRIVWEGDKTPSGSGDTYTYGQSKKGAVRGSKKRAIRTPYGDDVDVQIDKHMSFPDKKGGSDTYRRKVRGKHKTTIGRGTQTSDTDTTIDSTYTKQTRGGKVLKKEYMPETEESKRAIMKEVQEEVVRPKKKKTVKKKEPVKKEPVKKEPVENKEIGMAAPEKYRELYKKKAKKWLKDEAQRKTDNTVQKQAQRETDSTVQKQIKSGFGDWSSSDNFGKKIKSDFAKKKKRILSGFDKNKREQESSFEKKKREMKASFEKKKIRLGG